MFNFIMGIMVGTIVGVILNGVSVYVAVAVHEKHVRENKPADVDNRKEMLQ